ncbi:MAG: tetratricopeptide repeat protein [Methylococcales bacterium]|nr:tetratricopeptide repeat protein [Methylococcales bacterium]
MINKKNMLNTLGTAVLCIGLMACETPEQQKANYLAQGKQYLEDGEYEKAVLALKNLQQIDPNDWDSHFLLGEAFTRQGKIDAAFKEYSLVVKQNDANLVARLRMAELLLLSHNVERANIIVNSVLAVQPDNAEALLIKAGADAARQEYQKALLSLEKARQYKADETAVTIMQAVIYSETGKLDQAIALLRTAMDTNPQNIRLLSTLAGFYIRKQQLPEADEILQKIIKVNPDEYEYYKKVALYQIAANQPDKAEAILREAVQKLPDNDAAKINLIDFLAEKRNPDQAIAELSVMVRKNPDNIDLKFKLARLQLSKKDLTGAEQTLKEVVTLDKLGPLGVKARDMLESVYMLTNRPEEARTLVKEVLDINPRDNDSLILRGEFAKADNRLADAIADFNSVLTDQPKNVPVLKMLAGAYILTKNNGLASEALEKVIGLAPDDEIARLDLATLQFKAGNTQQAKQQVENFLKTNPGSIKSYERIFRFNLAEKQWEKALDIAKQVQQLASKDGLGWYMAGLSYQIAKKPDLAIQAFQEALLKNPGAVEPLAEMTKMYIDSQQTDKAAEKLQQVIKQLPGDITAYFLLGKVFMAQHKFSEAKVAFLKAQELKQDWYASYQGLAEIELAQNNETGAISILQAGMDKTKGAMELVAELAGIYRKQGQNKKLLALYEQAYKTHPESLQAANNLAAYLADYSETPEDLERAANIAGPLQDMNSPVYMETLAWIAYKQADYNKAKDIMQKVVEQQPSSVTGQYHLGMILFQLKETGMAAYYLRKALNAKQPFDGEAQADETLKKIQDDIL